MPDKVLLLAGHPFRLHQRHRQDQTHGCRSGPGTRTSDPQTRQKLGGPRPSRQHTVGQRPLRSPRKRAGRQACGNSSREVAPGTSNDNGLPEAPGLGEILGGRRKMACRTESPRFNGDTTPPRPKKSCLDRARNAIARTAAQIRTGHWRSAVYLKRIRKRSDDTCWFCNRAKMTRSHVLLHCPNERLAAGREEAWEGKKSGGVRVLLANPRREQRFVKFLELTDCGRRDR